MTKKTTAMDARHKCRRRLLELRAMYRLLETPAFEDAADKATAEQVQVLDEILKSESSDMLRSWIKKTLDHPLEMRGIRELKEMARELFIPKYSRMSRAQLIKALYATSVGQRKGSD